jgi:nucleotide-binding universal stress UspA family protein
MHVLVPIDGSESSLNALEFGALFAREFGANLDVVHVTDERTAETEELFERARDLLSEVGVDGEPEAVLDDVVTESEAARKVGRRLIELAAERGYDHVVMGRESGGRLERFVVGSASETLVEESDLPLTLVP